MSGIVSKALFSSASFLRKVGKNLSASDRAWNQTLKEWKSGDEVHNYRFNYPNLDENAIVFDLGGYKGDWASGIFSSYLCNIFVFEPHPIFYKTIVERFKKNDKIKVFQKGLGKQTKAIQLSTSADATSAFGNTEGKSVEAQIQEYKIFLAEHNIQQIALMKINIEGGEYDLLDHMIEESLIQNVENIQIQFHNFVPQAEERMKRIQDQLHKTHELTYSFPFFWENWERK